jgi:dTDP-4-amino-4,6-dideoxygalactose transaminase
MVGFNFRMTEMQSAIGLEQLKILDTWNLPRRRANGEHLLSALAGIPQIRKLPVHGGDIENGFWLFPIILDIDALSCRIGDFTAALAAEGIPCGPVMWPQCYKERVYREHRGFGRLNYPFGDPATRPEAVDYAKAFCPNAAWVEERCFFVPTHPTYDLSHMALIAEGIRKVIAAFAE